MTARSAAPKTDGSMPATFPNSTKAGVLSSRWRHLLHLHQADP
ncbi:MAG: hypothetical protein VCE75_00350 [Alphaproteobacteria bacterium]